MPEFLLRLRYIKYSVTGTVEGLKSPQGLEKGCFLGSLSGSYGDRPQTLRTWLAGVSSSSANLRDQVGVQLLALVEGHTVQHPLSGHHKCLTHLPNCWGQRTQAEISVTALFPRPDSCQSTPGPGCMSSQRHSGWCKTADRK